MATWLIPTDVPTLQDAFNAAGNFDTIRFELSGSPYAAEDATPINGNTFTIEGEMSGVLAEVVIDGGGTKKFYNRPDPELFIPEGLIIRNLRLQNCRGGIVNGVNGGAINAFLSEGMIVWNCFFHGCQARGSGGAIHMQGDGDAPAFGVYHSEFLENIADENGGALDIWGTAVFGAMNCHFYANEARGDGATGGGICFNYCQGNSGFDYCTFRDNFSAVQGGAVGVIEGL